MARNGGCGGCWRKPPPVLLELAAAASPLAAAAGLAGTAPPASTARQRLRGLRACLPDHDVASRAAVDGVLPGAAPDQVVAALAVQ